MDATGKGSYPPVGPGRGWSGEELIVIERRRQIDEKGYTALHDSEHGPTDLGQAGMSYEFAEGPAVAMPSAWPWAPADWKPKDRLSNLVRAGALYLAAADLRRMGEDSQAEGQYRRHANEVARRIDTLLHNRRLGMPDWAEDAVIVNLQIGLDMWERIRLLLGARLDIRVMVFCQKKPGRTGAESTVSTRYGGESRKVTLHSVAPREATGVGGE